VTKKKKKKKIYSKNWPGENRTGYGHELCLDQAVMSAARIWRDTPSIVAAHGYESME